LCAFVLAPASSHASAAQAPKAAVGASEKSCDVAIAAARRSASINLPEVLQACPALARQIVWTAGDGKQSVERAWPPAMRTRFLELFQLIETNASSLRLQCPTTSSVAANRPDSTWVYVAAQQAFEIYAAHVAHALYLEIKGTVPWSVRTMPAEEAAEIFSSDRYFARIVALNGMKYPAAIQPGRDFQLPVRAQPGGDALVCDPRIGERFVRGETSTGHADLMGATDTDTLVRLVWWFQQNVHHDPPGKGPGGLAYSAPNTIRMYLQTRLRVTPTPSMGRTLIAAYGCHSAANLLYDLAKSVNIPLLVGNMLSAPPKAGSAAALEHAGLAYHWMRPDALVLEHADDMYPADGAAPGVIGTATPLLPPGVDVPHNFFAAVWRSPQYWNAHHFHYGAKHGDAYVPTTDMDGLFHLADRYGGLPHAGWQLGYWEQATPADVARHTSTYFFQSMFADSYATCSWTQVVKPFCSVPNATEAQFLAHAQSVRNNFPARVPSPWPLTPADFYRRAAACVESVGGCAAAQTAVDQWTAAVGSNVLP
jgi:hypothetical protein